MSPSDGDGPRAVPDRDPLADLVSRSVGARVEAVEVEVLPASPGVERKRLRFDTGHGATSAIFERRPRGEILEAQLLPFLARKTDRVPRVYSRGLPPPHASLGPWLLLEDVFQGPAEDDVEVILQTMRAIERAVASDLPALRALGVPGSGSVLVHGALTREKARRIERGVVIVGWASAYLGAATDDERLLK
jgi:hypothetical protein